MMCLTSSATAAPLAVSVEFDRHIRPILSETCYQCHGPDVDNRQSNLRLDTPEWAFADLGGYRAIVPGDPAASALYQRITAESQTDRMPPADSGRQLTPLQIETIRQWIEQGARWQEHWSFDPPRRPPLPAVSDPTWVRNAIDLFVLARLEREGLAPSPAADKVSLIRRVTLDLTGLPPAPLEVHEFLQDQSPGAYEKVVERLLASPRFGERMATPWLDAARYADTSGYQNDGPRYMWRWRDWVIGALNDNMPFDQFTIQQLAGDLLPHATLDQRIATGFNRNHRGNAEGGIIPEEYAVEYVVDRVTTTSTVWLGLTMECARCHDHKFDPISQKEFYQLFAYFNNVPEFGRAIKDGNSPPLIQAPTPQHQIELDQLCRGVESAQAEHQALRPALASAEKDWEESFQHVAEPIQWAPADGLLVHYALDGSAVDSTGQAQGAEYEGGQAAYLTGMLGQAADFDGQQCLVAGDVAKFGYFDKFSCAASVFPRDHQGGTILSRMTDAAQADGYYICLVDGHVEVNLVKRWLDDAIRVQTRHAIALGQWHHVAVTYDGSRVAGGIKVFVNGEPQELEVKLDGLNQSFVTAEPLRIGGGGGPEGRFHGAIDEVRIYHRALTAEEVAVVATKDTVNEIVSTPAEARTPFRRAKLRAYFLDKLAPENIQSAHRQLLARQQQYAAFMETIPTVMVLEEMASPRQTHVLVRGQYDRLGEQVAPGVPASLPPLGADLASNRLGLARWLVDPAHPLTSRVAVNRCWHMLFGTGLVETLEDFGAQGDRPSHPELLDWLAIEFIRSGWDVKAILKTIVTSSTYRQSSGVTPEREQRDPDNRLLARGPRFRLSAEMVRDQALAASGLLVEKMGGASVKPYQPAGLWNEIATDTEYNQDEGGELYRRSLYTYWKRTVAPPAMMTLDAPSRETCVVRRPRTNTPLQALALMNDVTFVQCARALALRMMTDGGQTPAARIDHGLRLVTGRRPTLLELEILLEGYHWHVAKYGKDIEAATHLVHSGDWVIDKRWDTSQLAAYTVVASLILNLDETITRE